MTRGSNRHDLQVADLPPRFWRLLEASKGDTCWPWAGPMSNDGYPMFTWRRAGGFVTIGPHRVVYALSHGWFFPPQVHHECGTRSCVRPEHLLAMSSAAEHYRRHRDE
jgi:hypothetical protein